LGLFRNAEATPRAIASLWHRYSALFRTLAIDGAGFDWSDMEEDEIQANMALMAFTYSKVSNDKSCLQNYEALKKQYDDLLVKLDDTGFKAATYKRGDKCLITHIFYLQKRA
ncbi:hypothetical protein Tco_0495091, partial [Tanacetum coccineum]